MQVFPQFPLSIFGYYLQIAKPLSNPSSRMLTLLSAVNWYAVNCY